MPSTRRPAPASTAAAAAATPSTAKAKPKPKHSADDENRPGGVRWGDLQSGTAVMVSGDCSGVEAEPGEVVPATICDGAECLHLNVTRDGQVSLAPQRFRTEAIGSFGCRLIMLCASDMTLRPDRRTDVRADRAAHPLPRAGLRRWHRYVEPQRNAPRRRKQRRHLQSGLPTAAPVYVC